MSLLFSAGIIVVKPSNVWETKAEPRILDYNDGPWTTELPHLGLGSYPSTKKQPVVWFID